MNPDHFAEIGARTIGLHPDLEVVKPPELPPILLAATHSDPAAAFSPLPKMRTAEQLAHEVADTRSRFEPFLKDLAPKLENERLITSLTEFDWRMETAEDLADARLAIDGGGIWQRINVPHFGGPIGKARAYYRTTFEVTQEMVAKGALVVRFEGVDYRTAVFVNGHLVGTHEGFFAPFEVECRDHVREGANSLVVRVDNDAAYMGNSFWGQDEEGDKLFAATNLGWDDPQSGWHHCPPGFGIYRSVTVEARASLHISDIFVRPRVDESAAEAWIEISSSERTGSGVILEVSVHGQNFPLTVVDSLRFLPSAHIVPGLGDLEKPDDDQDVALIIGPGPNLIKIPLSIPEPRLWDLDTPWLYQIQVRLLDTEGAFLDAAARQFGMRTFTQDVENEPRGRFYLNGREIRLRGANTMGFEQQDVFTGDIEQLIEDLLLVRAGNLNFLRLTQRPVEREVYDFADRLGVMTQTDLPLFGCLRYTKFAEAIRQAEEMERIVRSHPCNVLVSFINEPFPNAHGKPHRHLNRVDLQAFFESAERAIRVLNPDRVVKHVDGDYDPPGSTLPDNHCYAGWYNGHGVPLGELHRGHWLPVHDGWSYACGEFGSEGLDDADLMRRRYPSEWLPRDGADWSPSAIPGAQTGDFHYLWFDTRRTLEDWVAASQKHQAWATRLLAERFRRDNRMVSFAIHLFIDAFPSSWMKAILDCERNPKPAFFAYREALEPLTVNIRTDRWKFASGEGMPFEFWVFNDTALETGDLTLRWQIERDGDVLFAQQTTAAVAPVSSTFQGFFTPIAPDVVQRTTYTVRLALADESTLIADTEIEIEVFPPIAADDELAVRVLGDTGTAARLADEVGAGLDPHARVVLVDDFDAYARDRTVLDDAAAAGARIVFLNLSAGEYHIGEDSVRIEALPMQPRQFVSRATGHPMIAGFQEEDFKFWFDPASDCVTPLLRTSIDAAGWDPVVITGRGEWMGRHWAPVPAVAERKVGVGAYVVCQLDLVGRTTHNPTAARFALRMLGRRADA